MIRSHGKKLFHKLIYLTFFPASVSHNTVAKIIQSKCILQTKKYVPVRSLWLNRVFADLGNSHEKHCLTIVYGYINKNDPGH